MALSDILLPEQGWELVAEGYKFTEGPAADAKGNLYFTDVPESKVYRLDENGKAVEFIKESQRTNGLCFAPDGRLFGCRNGAREIVIFDAAGNAQPIAQEVTSNDLAVTREGGVYFTDPQNKQVWYVSPAGEKRVVSSGIERPNGIVLWPDGKTLVVADTLTRHLWTFRVEPGGDLTVKQPYYTAQMVPDKTGSGADGVAVDSSGHLYVATHLGIQVFDTQGRHAGIIASPQDKVLSNITFGGPEFDWLYATCSDKVFRRKVKTRGVRYVKPEP